MVWLRKNPEIAFISAWAVPGLAHFIMGRHKQGLVFLVFILALFISGAVMSDFKGVSPRFHPFTFYGQLCCGAPTILHLLLFGQPTADYFKGTISTYYDAGILYMMIAGLLNIVAIADALERTVKKRGHQIETKENEEKNGAKEGVESGGTSD
jgi:hypothetical protein